MDDNNRKPSIRRLSGRPPVECRMRKLDIDMETSTLHKIQHTILEEEEIPPSAINPLQSTRCFAALVAGTAARFQVARPEF